MIGASSKIKLEVQTLRYRQESQTPEVVQWNNGRWLNVGDLVEFRVSNLGSDPVDVTILFIDENYGIQAVFPELGLHQYNRLLADGPVAEREAIVTRRFQITPAEGEERLVVIGVGAEPQRENVDLSFLAQPALERVRGVAREPKSSLGRLLDSAVFAHGRTRGMAAADVNNYQVRQITWKVIKEP